MNFFKKYWIAILIITVLGISFIIGFFEGIYENKQEPKSLLNYIEELDNDKELNHPLRTKRKIDSPKPKIPITQTNYDKIKSYILSENENEVLSLSDLSEEEITTIEKDRNSQKQTLEFRKEDKKVIDEYQPKCNDLKNQIKLLEINPLRNEYKIEGLTNILCRTQKYKEDLEKDLNRILEKNNQFALSSLNSLYEITSAEE